MRSHLWVNLLVLLISNIPDFGPVILADGPRDISTASVVA